ncbi:MAG: hypothetical protein WCP39_07145, partial [Chlamydiota bacterium]
NIAQLIDPNLNAILPCVTAGVNNDVKRSGSIAFIDKSTTPYYTISTESTAGGPVETIVPFLDAIFTRLNLNPKDKTQKPSVKLGLASVLIAQSFKLMFLTRVQNRIYDSAISKNGSFLAPIIDFYPDGGGPPITYSYTKQPGKEVRIDFEGEGRYLSVSESGVRSPTGLTITIFGHCNLVDTKKRQSEIADPCLDRLVIKGAFYEETILINEKVVGAITSPVFQPPLAT